jgi:hypothetical protein
MIDFVLTRVPGSYTHFQPIQIGDLTVSIQASQTHYCSPRRDGMESDYYDRFEVALILNDEWFHPERDKRFSKTTWSKYWSSFDNVAADVPRDEIENMLDDLHDTFVD